MKLLQQHGMAFYDSIAKARAHKTIADIFELQIVAVSKVRARRLRAGKSRLWPA